MSNSTIAKRMLEIVSAFQRGETSALRVVETVELHAPALEGITRKQMDELSQLAMKVLRNDYSDFERQQLGLEEESTAPMELQAALEKLLM